MMVRCDECGVDFDDARNLTYCPHAALMSDSDMAQKDLAIALIADGKPVRFAHQAETGPDYRIISIGWNGMVSLHGQPGEFAPHLFVKPVDRHTVG